VFDLEEFRFDSYDGCREVLKIGRRGVRMVATVWCWRGTRGVPLSSAVADVEAGASIISKGDYASFTKGHEGAAAIVADAAALLHKRTRTRI